MRTDTGMNLAGPSESPRTIDNGQPQPARRRLLPVAENPSEYKKQGNPFGSPNRNCEML